MMKTRRNTVMMAALLGAACVLGTAGCASQEKMTPAQQAFATDLNACERMQKNDERQNCVDAARAKFNAASRRESSCPPATC